MSKQKHTVAVLKSDGTAFAVTHWDRAEDALKQFGASLRLVGHPEHRVKHHLENAARQKQAGYEVLNPDLQGSIRISTTRP